MSFNLESKYWTAADSQKYCHSLGLMVSLPTVTNWITKNSLGVQFVKRGAWYVKPEVFKNFINKRVEVMDGADANSETNES